VLDDHAVDNPPDVNVGPRNRSTCGLGTREQSHSRGSVAAVDRHVVDNEVAFSDEVVVIDGDLFTEIVFDRREDLLPTLSALRTSEIVFTTCGVVHQAFGDKFIDDGVITCHYATKQLFDDILRLPAVHPLILPVPASSCERQSGGGLRWSSQRFVECL
jgi:hypothetical protein